MLFRMFGKTRVCIDVKIHKYTLYNNILVRGLSKKNVILDTTYLKLFTLSLQRTGYISLMQMKKP